MSVPTRTHLVVGEPDEVAAVIDNALLSGLLVEVEELGDLPDGRISVIVEVLDPEARLGWPRWLVAVAGVVGLAAVAGVVWLLVLAVVEVIALVSAVAAWVAAHVAAVVAVAGGLVLLGIWLRAGSCAGSHCRGCRR